MLRDAEDEEKVRNTFPQLFVTAATAEQRGTIEFPELSLEEEGKLLAFLASEHIGVTKFERKEADLENLFLHAISE